MRRQNDTQCEKRRQKHDRVQRALELTAEWAKTKRARACVKFEEHGIRGLRRDKGPAEHRKSNDIGELRTGSVPGDAATAVVERWNARVCRPRQDAPHELVLHALGRSETRLAGAPDALDARDEGGVDVGTRELCANGTRDRARKMKEDRKECEQRENRRRTDTRAVRKMPGNSTYTSTRVCQTKNFSKRRAHWALKNSDHDAEMARFYTTVYSLLFFLE